MLEWTVSCWSLCTKRSRGHNCYFRTGELRLQKRRQEASDALASCRRFCNLNIWNTDYRTFNIGIFETLQRALGLETSNCTIEIASVGQRTMHRPQRIHFSSSMIMSAP